MVPQIFQGTTAVLFNVDRRKELPYGTIPGSLWVVWHRNC